MAPVNGNLSLEPDLIAVVEVLNGSLVFTKIVNVTIAQMVATADSVAADWQALWIPALYLFCTFGVVFCCLFGKPWIALLGSSLLAQWSMVLDIFVTPARIHGLLPRGLAFGHHFDEILPSTCEASIPFRGKSAFPCLLERYRAWQAGKDSLAPGHSLWIFAVTLCSLLVLVELVCVLFRKKLSFDVKKMWAEREKRRCRACGEIPAAGAKLCQHQTSTAPEPRQPVEPKPVERGRVIEPSLKGDEKLEV